MELVPALAAAFISIGAATASFILARRLGLTDIQAAVDHQEAILVATLKTRVELLEAENARQKDEILQLEQENQALRRRVDRLERHLADKAVGDA